MIKVVTDSTSDLPSDLAQSLGIEVQPIYIIWDGKSYRDGIDMLPDEVYRRLGSSSSLPTTSQPTPADFQELYGRLAEKYEGIVSIHISSRLSGTCNSALEAAKALAGRLRIEVVDSRVNSMGLALIAVAAARLAKAGGSISEVLSETRKTMTQIKMLSMFDTLKYAVAGGRINKSIGKVASILNIRPLLTFRNGEVVPAGAVRTYAKGVDKLIDFVRKNLPAGEIGIAHAAAHQAAEKMRQEIRAISPASNIIVSQMGASLGAHGGPGLLLVALRTSA